MVLSPVALFHREAGAGVPLLLLHGFPFTGESFWPQLEAPPAGARVLAPDHRGFGQSPLGEGPSTMDALADDALALLDRLGVGRAVVGGVSMGGYVALALLRRDPARVAGLALLDTQALPDDAAGKERREAQAREVLALGVGGLVDAQLPRLFGPDARPEVRARLEAQMRAASPAAVVAALRGMAARPDAREVLSRYAGPLLVVVGEKDLVTPPGRAREMADLVPSATLLTVPGAGHLAHLEAPEPVRAALAALCARAG